MLEPCLLGSPRGARECWERAEPSRTPGEAAGGDQGARVSGGQVQGRTQPAIQEGSAGEREAAGEEDHTLCSFCCAGGAGLSLPSSFKRQAQAGAERSGVTKPALLPPGVGAALSRPPLDWGERKSLTQLERSEFQQALSPSSSNNGKTAKALRLRQPILEAGSSRAERAGIERETVRGKENAEKRRKWERKRESAPGKRRPAGRRVRRPSRARTLDCASWAPEARFGQVLPHQGKTVKPRQPGSSSYIDKTVCLLEPQEVLTRCRLLDLGLPSLQNLRMSRATLHALLDIWISFSVTWLLTLSICKHTIHTFGTWFLVIFPGDPTITVNKNSLPGSIFYGAWNYHTIQVKKSQMKFQGRFYINPDLEIFLSA
ncbi:uncharacterized protein LOC107135395 [Marmota marmota marmota]|uniref:uncharacterized protein LOC107135395 n=1 Tax=Marmota marmota marmota TaxID=9994 RepID=UPI0020925ABB|nr:uncharacterized protein LOC107135395 [Marmota marmota marmota]